MNAIDMLEEDHRKVSELFAEFEEAGEQAFQAKGDVVKRITRELRVHSELEEQIFYPATRKEADEAEETVQEAIEEHHVAASLMVELEGMAPQDQSYDAKVTVLIENVRHHVEEEEGELFPQARKELGSERLSELGEEMRALKERLTS